MREGEETGPSELPLNESRELKSEGKTGHRAKPALWKHPAVLWAIIGATVVVIIALAATRPAEKSKQPPPCPTAPPGCPDGWFRSRGRCYYFSKDEKSWTDSQNNCSSLAASLAQIENLQELKSQLPYPGRLDHWIGLQKGTDGVWRWVDGTKFDHRFRIQGGADCAYLDEDLNVSSSICSRARKWFCSKPDAPT